MTALLAQWKEVCPGGACSEQEDPAELVAHRESVLAQRKYQAVVVCCKNRSGGRICHGSREEEPQQCLSEVFPQSKPTTNSNFSVSEVLGSIILQEYLNTARSPVFEKKADKASSSPH